MNKNYSKAYVEVLEILKYFFEDEMNQLPDEDIKFYEDNCDKNYVFEISPETVLDDIDLSKEAIAILVNLYVKYLATAEEKAEIRTILEENKKFEELLKKEEDSASTKEESIPTETLMQQISTIEQSESIFKRITSFIKKIFNTK